MVVALSLCHYPYRILVVQISVLLFKGDYYRTYLCSLSWASSFSACSALHYLEARRSVFGSSGAGHCFDWRALPAICAAPKCHRSTTSLVEYACFSIQQFCSSAITVSGRSLAIWSSPSPLPSSFTSIASPSPSGVSSKRNSLKESPRGCGLAVADLKREDNSFFRITSLHASEHGTETECNDPCFSAIMAPRRKFLQRLKLHSLSRWGRHVGYYARPTLADGRLAGNFLRCLLREVPWSKIRSPFREGPSMSGFGLMGSSLFATLSLPLGLSYTRYPPEAISSANPDGKKRPCSPWPLSIPLISPLSRD